MLTVPVLLIGLNGTGSSVAAVAHQQLALKVLLIAEPPDNTTTPATPDPTTAAWESSLSSEGVAYTEVAAVGTVLGSQTVTLPTLSSGTTGNFNGVVFADTPTDFAAGQLTALNNYETTFGVRQVDGYMFPDVNLGVNYLSGGALDNTTGELTAAGKTVMPELVGPVPFDTGTFGYAASVTPGQPVTPILDNASGSVIASVYQHPSTDAQAGVSELSLNFNYNASQTQWLLMAPGLINWVTNDTHLGLYRNYFGQDIDDVFIADNEWDKALQCTPGATNPPDYTCPTADQGVELPSDPDVQMSATDVAYVANWEQQTGIKLNLAFNAIGACTSSGAASDANCTGSSTSVPNSGGTAVTATDPGHLTDSSYPDDAAFVNALLADKSDFNWIAHTWSHQFLGCNVWAPQPLTSVTSATTGGTLAAGTYSYEITAATAYGESEPSLTKIAAITTTTGSATLTWPNATNGVGQDGVTPGPTLAQLEASFPSPSSGFWGYSIYRENPGSTTFGLVGQVPENGSQATYTFTDTGAKAPGESPGSSAEFPTATDPGIDCSSAAGSWDPYSSTTADGSIEDEIGLDTAFAAANGLPNYSPSAIVTGEHSGLENPNIAKAFTDEGITTFASDGSRQPQSYAIGAAVNSPRYPSNIYYNASNWPDEVSEYSTIYASTTTSIGNGQFGHCAAKTDTTTCLTTAPTESSILASESHIMLSHVLDNDPRVNYAHQPNLMGHTTNGVEDGYTILTLINDMLSQYNSWYNASAPISQMTDATESTVLAEQTAWAAAETAGTVTASSFDGSVTVTNNGSTSLMAPVTAPVGSTMSGAAYGTPYGGQLSAWTSIPAHGSITIVTPAPVFTSSATTSTVVGSPFSFAVTTSGTVPMTVGESGTLPAGLSYVDNGDGTATIAGTPTTVGSSAITLTATNTYGISVQTVTIAVTPVPVAAVVNPAVTTPPAPPSSSPPNAVPSTTAVTAAPAVQVTPPAPKVPACAPVITTSKLVATKALVRLKVRYGNGRCARVFSITVKTPVRTVKGARVTTRLATVVVGRKALTVSTAQLRTVSLTMSSAGRRLVAAATAKRPLHATLTETGAGAKTVTRSITIRPAS